MLFLLQILEMFDDDDNICEDGAVEQEYYDLIGKDIYVLYLMLTFKNSN